MSRARRGARTSCATASNPKQPNQDCARGFAPPRRTGASTWAMRADASWSHANGPAKPWPTTKPTAWPRSCAPSATHPAAFPPHFLGDGDRIAWKLAQPTDPDCHPENTACCGPSARR